MNTAPLLALQNLLAQINDAPTPYRIADFLIGDAKHCSALLGRDLVASEDEQVLIQETEVGAELGVYIDECVTARLVNHNPMQQLCDANLADFCTAIEGISHFQYLVWCLEHARQVSLLELELQAEVDKYAVATWLVLHQGNGRFHPGLHQRMFSQVAYLPGLQHDASRRYLEANRCAARFCRRIDERFLSCRQPRVERWLGELRRLFRSSHHEKVRRTYN